MFFQLFRENSSQFGLVVLGKLKSQAKDYDK